MSSDRDLDTAPYRVREGERVVLADRPTRVEPVYESKKDAKKLLAASVDELRDHQEMFYAHNRYALLLIFQAMDAAGKDGAIKHVMSGVNPQGCQVSTFKQPSENELEHDFLWRTTLALPERGRIGIFNRSYYEEVLVVRVHPELLERQGLPDETLNHGDVWTHRYESIRDHERHLHRNGTRIVKFFLHLSRDEQRRRFIARIDEPEKHWKFNEQDVAERAFWDDYQRAYEDALTATSTTPSPWFVIPADDKDNARILISRVIVETMDGLDMHYPKTTPQRRRELLEFREQLESD